MVRRLALVLALLLPMAAAPGLARAQALDFGSGPVLLLADEVQVDTAAKLVTALGDVQVVRGERRLLADRLIYDQNADRITAQGNVILLEPTGDAVFADEVTISGDLQNGVIEQLQARLTDDALFAAAAGRRIDGNTIELDNATYTPCPVCEESDDDPLWQLSASRITHDQTEREISYRNAFLEMGGVPVLYTPYLFHPDPTVERKSGFLAPSFGRDSELGFLLQTPYHFALAPNYDLTLAPILLSKENPVLTGEYRHLLPNGRFEIGGSGTYASRAANDDGVVPPGDEFRGHVEGEGRLDLPNRWQAGIDLAAASDKTYLDRYGFSNANVLQNEIYARRITGRNFVSISGNGFQGLREQDEQDEIPIVMPRGRMQLYQPWRWGSRFRLDADGMVATRTGGLNTNRLSGTGAYELPWQGPLGDRARLSLEMHGQAYRTNGNPRNFSKVGTTNYETRVYPRATAEWNWPWINDQLPFTPLLEPTVSATWAPTYVDDKDDEIPNEDSQDFVFDDSSLFEPNRFPGLDRVEPGARVNYGLRFGGFGGDSGTLVSGLFGQSFRLDDSSDFNARTGLDGRASDYVGRIDFTPHSWLDVRYRFGLDKDNLSFLRNELGARVGPRALRFDVDYTYLEDDPAVKSERKREEITAGASLRLTDSVTVRYQTRRNLQADRNIFHKFALVYNHPCLKLVAGIEQKNTSQGDALSSTTFKFRVVFLNLGEVRADSGMLGSLGGSGS